MDSHGNYNVFVPSVQFNSAGTTWASGQTPGTSIPISKFFIAQPTSTAAQINAALLLGQNLILTPGIYDLNQTLLVTRPDAVVLGIGFPTLIPENGIVSMIVLPSKGVMLSGIIFDAGIPNSPLLLQFGTLFGPSSSSDPAAIQDVFFRIGGAEAGQANVSLSVGSNNTIHEMPYDPPSQAAWMEAPGVDGWAAFKVTNNVTSFTGYGMGSYSFFNQGVNIYAANAFEVPTTLKSASMNDLLTIFLSTAGFGGILNVIDNTGGSSTIANPDTPVTVVSYP
jgi:hypothetical protein